jgi:LETM1 and EF-hand domain-containing protein 1
MSRLVWIARRVVRTNSLRRLYSNQPPNKIKIETPVETALREAKDDAIQEFLKGTAQVKEQPKKPMLQRIKEEIVHYWHGSQLLVSETAISYRLLVKLLKGKALTRRELRQVSLLISCVARLGICCAWCHSSLLS